MKKLPNSQTLAEKIRETLKGKLNCEGVRGVASFARFVCDDDMIDFTSGLVVCRSDFRRDLEDMEDARALLIDVERQRLGRSRLWTNIISSRQEVSH